jgi:hypothetical protein
MSSRGQNVGVTPIEDPVRLESVTYVTGRNELSPM